MVTVHCARWKQVKQIVNSCLDREPGRRKEHILAACAGNPALLAEVEGMLASYAEVGDFLETPALEGEHERILTLMLGRTIGHVR